MCFAGHDLVINLCIINATILCRARMRMHRCKAPGKPLQICCLMKGILTRTMGPKSTDVTNKDLMEPSENFGVILKLSAIQDMPKSCQIRSERTDRC